MRRRPMLFLALALWGAHPAAEPADRVAAPPAAFAAQLIELVNDYRRENGLRALNASEELAAIAFEHSEWMAGHGRLSHDGFRARFRRSQSRVCVENLGWNYRLPETQLAGWLASPPHQRNLLDPAVIRVGVAVSSAYVTFFACG